MEQFYTQGGSDPVLPQSGFGAGYSVGGPETPVPAYGFEPSPPLPAPGPPPAFQGYEPLPPVTPYPPAHQGYPGMPPVMPMPIGYPPARSTNGLAIASLVCSLLGLVTCAATSVLGVIFGHIANSQIKRTGEEGQGMAVAGLIVGYIGVALLLVGVLFYFGLIAVMLGSSHTSTY
ncbi:DUF4190 domain-containing protein [Mycolicibacterium sp. CBMA 361]|uniref:DUF4190 domain-containing protein n=1 Tax=Mycolicibacterium sp. CBMA 361 TaxID=2606610 RepID=UPI0012DD6979|nr:DUF4190 domain-containing protein [Mycolicibacterium sp. CBMA 361]MUM34009.1 DUF4190 domain-containing protein [Mycolicibacterium sp. CBMA 361]